MFTCLDSTRPSIKFKYVDYTPEIIVVEIRTKMDEIVPICALLDTSTSSSAILLKKYIFKDSPKVYRCPQYTEWSIFGENFKTREKRLDEFKCTEFSKDKKITWVVHTNDSTNPSTASYDLIIGRDLLNALIMDISFDKKTVTWENVEVPMKQRGFLQDRTNVPYVYNPKQLTLIVQAAEAWLHGFLDSDYSKFDIKELVKNFEYLSLD